MLLPALALNVAGSAFADRPCSPVSPGSRCAAQKIEANGAYLEDLLACRAQTWTNAQANGRDCELKAKQVLAARYAKAESAARGACKTTGDAAAVASRIDTSAAALEATLRETKPSQCAKRKLSSIGEDAEDQHQCYAAAEAKGAGFSVDPACQDAATASFLAAFARTAPLPGCVAGTLDAPALDQQIRLTAFGSQATVAPPVSECAPLEVTTVHGQSFQGHSRLVKIENGQVPCVHGEDGTVARGNRVRRGNSGNRVRHHYVVFIASTEARTSENPRNEA